MSLVTSGSITLDKKQKCVSHFNCVWLFESTWTVTHQAPLSMKFSRQEYRSGLPFPSPEDLPNKRLKLGLPHRGQILYCLSYLGSPISNNSRYNLLNVLFSSLQLCLTLCDPVDCSPPGSSVHEILQARILKWAAILFSGDLSHPGIKPTSRTLQVDSLLSEPPVTNKS